MNATCAEPQDVQIYGHAPGSTVRTEYHKYSSTTATCSAKCPAPRGFTASGSCVTQHGSMALQRHTKSCGRLVRVVSQRRCAYTSACVACSCACRPNALRAGLLPLGNDRNMPSGRWSRCCRSWKISPGQRERAFRCPAKRRLVAIAIKHCRRACVVLPLQTASAIQLVDAPSRGSGTTWRTDPNCSHTPVVRCDPATDPDHSGNSPAPAECALWDFLSGAPSTVQVPFAAYGPTEEEWQVFETGDTTTADRGAS